jgi:archaeal flagellar protein FlaH
MHERIKTGVAGLDEEWGGFPRGRTILLTGDAGSGKTIFALQFAFACCAQGLRTVYIATEEGVLDLKDQARAFDWGKIDYEGKGLLTFVDLSSVRISEISSALELSIDLQKSKFDTILEAIPEGAQVVIVDSMGSHSGALQPREFKDRFDLMVHDLMHKGLSALVIIDSVTSATHNDLALFSAYGALKLVKRENSYTGLRERVIDIIKMRNTKIPLQPLVFKIDHSGIFITNLEELKSIKHGFL